MPYYGTNGFYLPFSDNTGATSTTIGRSHSGANDFTPSNLSVTAGAGNDSVIDTPTPYSDGGNNGGNYCTLNPLSTSGGDSTISDGGLAWSVPNNNLQPIFTSIRGTISARSGKWYYEATMTTGGVGGLLFGIKRTIGGTSTSTSDGNGWLYYGYSATKWSGSGGENYGASFGINDVIGVAYDLDNGSITFYKNGVSQGVAYSGQSFGEVVPALFYDSSNVTHSCTVNFGQRPFAYTPPAGFKALNTFNLP